MSLRIDKSPPASGAREGQQPVSVHIERLVIDGLFLTTRQADQLRESLERELVHLLRRESVSGIDGKAEAMRSAPAISITKTVHPAALGRQLAASLHHALSRQV